MAKIKGSRELGRQGDAAVAEAAMDGRLPSTTVPMARAHRRVPSPLKRASHTVEADVPPELGRSTTPFAIAFSVKSAFSAAMPDTTMSPSGVTTTASHED